MFLVHLVQFFLTQSDFSGWLFGKVAGVCYDLINYMEQYECYIDNLKIIDVSHNQDFIEKNLSSGTVNSVQQENSCKFPAAKVNHC